MRTAGEGHGKSDSFFFLLKRFDSGFDFADFRMLNQDEEAAELGGVDVLMADLGVVGGHLKGAVAGAHALRAEGDADVVDDAPEQLGERLALGVVERGERARLGIEITDAAMTELVRSYTHEAGVRNLERELANVMRASMSVPGAVAPAEFDGMMLVDGMLTSNLPVDAARAMGADLVIAVNVGTPLLKREELNGIGGVLEIGRAHV